MYMYTVVYMYAVLYIYLSMQLCFMELGILLMQDYSFWFKIETNCVYNVLIGLKCILTNLYFLL